MIGNKQAGGDILRVPDQAARLALATPYYGYVYQDDTDTLYSWSLNLSQWIVVNSGAGAFTINGFSLPDHVIEFDAATTETEPTITSADIAGIATHKLIIPSAAVSGVTAGLISNTDYELLQTLGDTVHEYEVYDSISSGTAGTVNKPAHGTVVFNQYEDAGDCIIVKVDTNGRPVDDPARDSSGNVITGTIDAAGNYTISAAPSGYPVAIVWQVQLAERWKSAELADDRIINETELPIAARVSFDDTASLLSAKNVQDAIDKHLNDRTITQEPTGFDFPELAAAGLSYSESDRKFTLGGAGYKAYYRGREIAAIAPGHVSAAHGTDLNKLYWYYHNGTAFAWSDSFPGFNNVLIGVAIYRTNDKFGIPETHGVQPWQSHRTDHYNIGTYRLSGGDISGVILSSTVEANRRPDISACSVIDEDLPVTNAALTTKQYSQRYLSGASADIVYVKGAAEIVPVVGAQPQYNQWTGTVWQQTAMPANSVMTVWLYEVPCTTDAGSQAYRHSWVQGQSITQAAGPSAGQLLAARNLERAKTTLDINLGQAAVISAEYVCIAKLIIQYTGGNWTVEEIINITGSRANQVGAPTGGFLSSVSTDGITITGDGLPADPIRMTGVFTPLADSTTAVQITKADGTTVLLNADTTNDVLQTGITNYENNVTSDNDIPNKKYVDTAAIKYSIALG